MLLSLWGLFSGAVVLKWSYINVLWSNFIVQHYYSIGFYQQLLFIPEKNFSAKVAGLGSVLHKAIMCYLL